jgi:hypothetical protein
LTALPPSIVPALTYTYKATPQKGGVGRITKARSFMRAPRLANFHQETGDGASSTRSSCRREVGSGSWASVPTARSLQPLYPR